MIDYGHGVVLDYVSNKDKDQFFHWRNDYSIWKWCRQNGPLTYTQHLNYWHLVDSCLDSKFFSIVGNESTLGCATPQVKTIGCAGLTSIDYLNSRAEFSLYIAPEHQKKGFGKKALKTLFSYGFGQLNMNSIWGETFQGNPALKMFLEIGMRKDGTRRSFYYRDGNYIDCDLVSVLRNEWAWALRKLL